MARASADGFSICRSGAICLLCPVAPFGMMVRMRLIHRLLSSSAATLDDSALSRARDQARTEWLEAITGLTDLTDSSSSGHEWREHERNEYHAIAVQPHCLPARTVTLQVRARFASCRTYCFVRTLQFLVFSDRGMLPLAQEGKFT